MLASNTCAQAILLLQSPWVALSPAVTCCCFFPERASFCTSAGMTSCIISCVNNPPLVLCFDVEFSIYALEFEGNVSTLSPEVSFNTRSSFRFLINCLQLFLASNVFPLNLFMYILASACSWEFEYLASHGNRRTWDSWALPLRVVSFTEESRLTHGGTSGNEWRNDSLTMRSGAQGVGAGRQHQSSAEEAAGRSPVGGGIWSILQRMDRI